VRRNFEGYLSEFVSFTSRNSLEILNAVDNLVHM
jgi:hypothetical protein